MPMSMDRMNYANATPGGMRKRSEVVMSDSAGVDGGGDVNLTNHHLHGGGGQQQQYSTMMRNTRYENMHYPGNPDMVPIPMDATRDHFVHSQTYTPVRQPQGKQHPISYEGSHDGGETSQERE